MAGSATVLPGDNPFLHEYLLTGAQRWRRFRADPAEALVVSLAVAGAAALAGYVAYTAARDGGGWLIAQFDRRYPLVALLVFAADTAITQFTLLGREARWRSGWLSGVAEPARMAAAQRVLLVLRTLVLMLSFAALLLFCLMVSPGAPAVSVQAAVAVFIALCAAPPCAAALARRQLRSDRRLSAGVPRPRSTKGSTPALRRRRGSIPVWQAAAIVDSWRSPALAWTLMPVLLLMPGAESPLVTLLVLVLGLLAALLGTAWTRSMDVLVRSSQWLLPQPIGAAALLLRALMLPVALLVLIWGAFSIGLCGFGFAPGVVVIVWAAGLALGLLHAACVCGWRHQPRRIGLAFTLQSILLVLVLQSAAPLAAPVWALLAAGSMRRALRT